MTATQSAALRSATKQVAAGAARGPVSTTAWGTVLWYCLVDRWHVLVDVRHPADLGTFVVIGILTTVWVTALRAGERKYPWMAAMLLSAGAPTYDGRGGGDEEEVVAPPVLDQSPFTTGQLAPPVGQPIAVAPPPYQPPTMSTKDATGTVIAAGVAIGQPPVVMADASPAIAAAILGVPQESLVDASVPFYELPTHTIQETAEYALADHPQVEIVGPDYQDEHALGAQHGVNAPDEMVGD